MALAIAISYMTNSKSEKVTNWYFSFEPSLWIEVVNIPNKKRNAPLGTV